jgi:hypothetical protein
MPRAILVLVLGLLAFAARPEAQGGRWQSGGC